MTGNVSGKELYFTTNGATVQGPFGWRGRESAQELDGTTGLDGGYTSNKAGLKTIEVTLSLVINILAGITGLDAGTVITNLRLFYRVGDATPAIVIPTFTVLSAEKGAEVNGRFELVVTGKNDGSYTINK